MNVGQPEHVDVPPVPSQRPSPGQVPAAEAEVEAPKATTVEGGAIAWVWSDGDEYEDVDVEAKGDVGELAANCGTNATPLWRRDDVRNIICNACGEFRYTFFVRSCARLYSKLTNDLVVHLHRSLLQTTNSTEPIDLHQ